MKRQPKTLSNISVFTRFSYLFYQKALDEISSLTKKLRQAARCFLSPTLILLCIAGAIRNGAGITLAFNVVNFFTQYHPDVVVSFEGSFSTSV